MAARLAVSVTGRDQMKYEIDPWITTPEYKTDTARAIDAYERLMERYMDLSESYLIDSQSVAQKLESIDAKMDDLSARLARIEKAMGIDPNGNIAPKSAKTPGTK
jgi:predicted Ser/Thr protein kinase